MSIIPYFVLAIVPVVILADNEAVNILLSEGTENTPEQLEEVHQILNSMRRSDRAQGRAGLPMDSGLEEQLKSIARLGERATQNEDFGNSENGLDSYMFEGDIMLNVPQARAIAGISIQNHTGDNEYSYSGKREKRQSNSFRSLWNKNKPIYYDVHSIRAAEREVIREAALFWERETCLKFEESSYGSPRLRFVVGSGCWSFIGRQTSWVTQDVSIGKGCAKLGTVSHEIAHALGFIHTQSRSDRDNYVYINFGNIPPGQQSNFQKVSSWMSSQETEYDFGSVMQYSPYAFAINPRVPTVAARDWRYQSTMGYPSEPSFSDIKAMNLLYKCGDFCSSPPECSNGGFVDSRECSKCRCPPQFQGKTCEDLKSGSLPICNGKVIQADDTWRGFTGKFGTKKRVYSWASSWEQQDCNWHIQAPAGKKVSIRLTKIPSKYCNSGCRHQYIEVNLKDFDVAGMRFCCDVGTQNLESEGDLVTIRASSTTTKTSFRIHYKAI